MFHNIKLYLFGICAFMMSIIPSFGIECTAPWVANGTNDACVCNDILYNGNCIESKFEIETTQIATNDYFAFQIGAQGEFYVDWGDGNVEPLTFNLNSTTLNTYAHKYTGIAQSYRIKFGGQATAYNTSENNTEPVIRFGGSWSVTPINTSDVSTATATNVKLYKIYGSLGQIFSGTPQRYMFYDTFYDCSRLTGTIPKDLFKNISGEPASGMFMGTFLNCSGLVGTDIDDPNNPGMKYAIPENLFSGISGKPAVDMFSDTFAGCSDLTGSIPENLFSGISGAPASGMFKGTFSDCSGLTGSIPENLFSGISGAAAKQIFYDTFYNCSGLTGSIPENLFSGISGSARKMFLRTFSGCTNLGKDEIGGTSTYYIPPTLFTGINTTSSSNMEDMFRYTGLLTQCDSNAGLKQYVTGFESAWSSKVSCIPTDSTFCKINEKMNATTHECESCSPNNDNTCSTVAKVWCYDGEYDAETGTCVTASNVFVCNPETGGTFTVLDAPMCLKKGLPQNNDVGLITKRDNQTYHIMLSTTDRVIHEGSSNKLVVIGSDTTWYAYDESVE